MPYKDPAARREHQRRHRRKWKLKANYGLELQAYHEMVVAQIGRCAICGEDFTTTPHVDHDHETGEVRGLLCGHCNTALHRIESDPEWGSKAVAYLERRAA